MAYNSDGYIMIDFTEVDFRRTNQTIDGLYKRCVDVIGTNKFILVINANGRTPLPATCSFTNNQYVIDTCIYMFAISSNDNLFIRRNDVPASDIIDDSSVSVDKTWSSNKIDNELDGKADASALADYQPKLTAGTNITIDENNVISSTGGAVIDDSVIVNNKVWSSLNTVEKLAPIDTIVSSPAEFKTSLALPLVECETSFSTSESGSGDKTPSNPYTLNGVDDVTITANGNDVFIDFGGTRYGGRVDVVNKKLSITYAKYILDGSVEPDTVNFRPQANSVGCYWNDLFTFNPPPNINTPANVISDKLATVSYGEWYSNDIDSIAFYKPTTIYRLCVRIKDITLTTKQAICDYLARNPITIVYEMEEPIEISISDIPTLSTIIGNNSFASDTGSLTVSYKALPTDLL